MSNGCEHSFSTTQKQGKDDPGEKTNFILFGMPRCAFFQATAKTYLEFANLYRDFFTTSLNQSDALAY